MAVMVLLGAWLAHQTGRRVVRIDRRQVLVLTSQVLQSRFLVCEALCVVQDAGGALRHQVALFVVHGA